jgi:transposase-like protein
MANGVVARDVKKEARWRGMVRGQSGSGLSVRAYCRQHGVREYSFYWWRAELSRRDAATAKSAFLPVTVAAEPAMSSEAGRIEIELAGNRRVHVIGPVDRRALADVLTVLGAVPC